MPFRVLVSVLAVAAFWPLPSDADDIKIDWHLKFPFRLFNDYSDTAAGKSYFTETASRSWLHDWSGRRDLYVDPECQAADSPILCSEESLGPERVSKMRSAIRPERKPDDCQNRLEESIGRLHS